MEALQFEVVESEYADGTPPVVTSLSISVTSINAPGTIELVAEATDDVSGVDSVGVGFRGQNHEEYLHGTLYATYWKDGERVPYEDGKLHGKITVNQHLESDMFILTSVSVYDVAGNYTRYERNPPNWENYFPLTDYMEALQFEVLNNGADVTTSVSKDTFVDEVANAEDDAYIAADYSGNATMPKEAFEAIAGTDKTIDLISDGITWRFEGSDITKTSKDIDLSVQITKAEENTSADGEAIQDKLNGTTGVVMKFAENGQLPGKATIQVKVDYAMREYLGSDTGLSVYYYNNQTGELELIASNLKVINDTYVEFPITHCSYYVLTNPNGSNGGSTAQGIAVDKTNFPDDNFRAWILSQDYGTDGVLTSDEVANVTWIDVSEKGIGDLAGIEHFTALHSLSCYDNQLTALDVSRNTGLTVLLCGGNQLTSLDVASCIALSSLNCINNLLTSLNISGCTVLTDLYCDSNQLTSLDTSKNTALLHLTCANNQLVDLNLVGNKNLTELTCSNNQLTNLDVSNCTSLTGLYCDNNKLTVLELSKNTALIKLFCYNNQLTELNLSGKPNLLWLHCYDNQLTKLIVRNNTALEHLACEGNQLTELDISQDIELKELACGINQIESLDVTNCTKLEYLECDDNKITELDLTNNPLLTELSCDGNLLTVLDLSKNTKLKGLQCCTNQLASLDLSNNPNCESIMAHSNRRNITVNGNNEFNLSKLQGFDVSKASDWSGCTVSNGVLTALSRSITYSYQINASKTVTFNLRANNYDPNAGKMEGTWGNLTWKIDGTGTLIISGTGAMLHYTEPNGNPLIDGYPWHRYADLIQSVVVEEGVTTLAEIAFHGLDNLQSVTLPDSLASIGGAAFVFCPNLDSIRIPENVSAIGKDAFIGSEHFREITFTGNAPAFDQATFTSITATAYYPAGNATWTTEVQQDYGGDITWVGHVFGQWTTEGNTSSRTCTRCGYTEHKVSTDSGDVEVEIPEQPELDVEVDPVLPSEENYILVEEALESTKYDVLKVFDITLKNSEGVHVQPNGTVKVKLPLDWSQNGNYKVYRVSDDGTLTDMNAYRQGSHMVFETDHFSIYVIAEKIDITAPTAKALTYTGSAQALVNAGSVTGRTMQYSLDGVTYSASVPTATNAGTYTVYYKVEGSHAAAQTVSVTIAKAEITITADNKVAAVGTAKPTLTYTVAGLKGSDKLSTNPTLACNATMSTAGDYEIVVSGGDAGVNYEIQRINGKLSVKNEHKVNVAAVTNGTVSVSHEKAIEGTEIAITATPKSGYHFSTLTVKDAAGTSYVVSTDNNGKYYFIMPDVDVTITVSFSKNITADPTNPKTGDEFAVVLWSGIMMTSLLCMAVIIPSRKKFR